MGKLTLVSLLAGVVLVANAENNVMRVPDSTRYFVMMLGAYCYVVDFPSDF